MKKLLLTGISMLTLAAAQQASAQIWSQNFNSATLPTGWVQINDGKIPAAAFNANVISKLTASGWAPFTRTASTGDSAMITTSYFNPVGKADRWLISQSFQVTSANMVLYWEDYAPDATYTDSMQVLISTSAGTTASAFTTTLWNKAGGIGGFIKHGLSLGAYNGQTVRVAFRDNSTDEFILYMDNAGTAIPAAVDASLTNLTPAASSPQAYGPTGTNVTLGATVTNNGATNLTSFVVKYQVGSNPVVSQTISSVNIGPYGTYAFNFTTPYAITATGSFAVKAWVEATGDAIHTNDTVTGNVTGVSFMPTKKLLVEEATGTWCGWCVRGIVYMDSMWKMHPDVVSLIAVHNNDPMAVTAYDNFLNPLHPSGYPSIVVDRREQKDPSEIFSVLSAEGTYFGFADMTLGTSTFSGNNVTIPVTVKPAVPMSGDYRLSLVITEDDAHGTTNHTAGTALAWDQHNYYSSTQQNLPLSGGGVNYQTSPEYLPASQMFYNFVGRGTFPSPSGAAGSLPATMAAGTTYNYSFTAALDPTWNRHKIRAVVMMIDNATGHVMNSQNSRFALGVADAPITGVSGVSIYPNPASSTANVSYTLGESASVIIEVTDVTGRAVASIPAAKFAAGEHIASIPVANLASGVYNVKVATSTGAAVTERLSVVK